MASSYRYSRCLNDSVIHSLPTRFFRQSVPCRRLRVRPYSSEDARQPDGVLPSTYAAKTPSLINITTIPAPHTGYIRVLTLNSPRNKNAISKQLLQELSDEILQRHYEAGYEMKCFERTQQRAAMGKGTRAIIIGSEVDGVFCAGADLKERKDMTEEEYVHSSSWRTRIMRCQLCPHFRP